MTKRDDCGLAPWSKRAIELEASEGPYCDYAAWLEWFGQAMQPPGVPAADIEFGGACDKVYLYDAFIKTIDHAFNAGVEFQKARNQ